MDLQIARNLGQMLESASRSLNIPFDASSVTVSLPSSVTSFINTKYYNIETSLSKKDIIKGLESNSDAEIYTALKHLVGKLALVDESTISDSMINDQDYDYNDYNDNSIVKEIVQLFPHIVKNVNSTNLKIKRLVYILLLRFNHLQQDISLLSINAIQKSLIDKNSFNRSLAIRCLSGIQIPAILPILLLSLTKLVKDSSPLVRSACSIAIIKCVQLDIQYNMKSNNRNTTISDRRSYLIENINIEGSNIQQLYLLLDILLSDNDSKVLSLAIIAFYEIFNGCFDIWHNKINNLINHFDELDSFAIVNFLDIMVEYIKLFYPKITELIIPIEINQLYEKIIDQIEFEMNCNVILSMVKFLIILFPFKLQGNNLLNKVMIKLIQNDYNDSIDNNGKIFISLNMIEYLISKDMIKFNDYQINNFIPLSNEIENLQIFELKINILFKLINNNNFNKIFKEFKFIIEKSQFPIIYKFKVLQKINKLILLNILTIEQFSQIIRFFMNKLTIEKNNLLVGEYITGLRQLIQSNLIYYIDILIKLSGKLFNSYMNNDIILVNNAKSSIIWLLGEFSINYDINNNTNNDNEKCQILKKMLPNIAIKLIENYKFENDYNVRYEILIFMTKLMIINIINNKDNYQLINNEIFQIFNYLLLLSKFDNNLTIRDISRLIGSILPNVIYFTDLNIKENLNIDELLLNDSTLLKHCQDKCLNINIALLMFQINKPQLSINNQLNNLEIYNNIDQSLLNYLKSGNNELDMGYLNYYNDLRLNEFKLIDYNKFQSSFSSMSINNNNETQKVNKPVQEVTMKQENVAKYRLQSLDDFLGS
ncbi:Apl6 protein [Pichia kluyveri]|uniref:Apl6 protein n=1 Tax=Pichia kluyveri TaxID=36015 RepID=A0AAV5R8D2_PICKL|nr:Apl6 protein [Pichia kluyveri]